MDAREKGQRIKAMREGRGLSGYALAKRTLLSNGRPMNATYLHRLERGEIENPGSDYIGALARALGVSREEVWPVDSQTGTAPPLTVADVRRLAREEAERVARQEADRLEQLVIRREQAWRDVLLGRGTEVPGAGSRESGILPFVQSEDVLTQPVLDVATATDLEAVLTSAFQPDTMERIAVPTAGLPPPGWRGRWLRVRGDYLAPDVPDGGLLYVLTPSDRDFDMSDWRDRDRVLATVDDRWHVRRLRQRPTGWELVSDQADEPIRVTAGVVVRGRVTALHD